MNESMLGNSCKKLIFLNPWSEPTFCPPMNNLSGYCSWIFGRQVIGWFFIDAQEILSKISREWNPVD